MSAKTSLGVEENVAGALCYVLTWLSGIIFILIEKENKFVRFHAFQSVFAFGGLMIATFIINLILGGIPYVGWLISTILWLAWLALWVLMVVKAYKGEKFVLPIVGDLASKQVDQQVGV